MARSDDRGRADWQFSIAALMRLTVAAALVTSVFVWVGRGAFVDGLATGGLVGAMLGLSYSTVRAALGKRTRRLRAVLVCCAVCGCLAAAWIGAGSPGGFVLFAIVVAAAIVASIAAEIAAVVIRGRRLRSRRTE